MFWRKKRVAFSFRKFRSDTSGATAIEYSLMVAGIAVAIFGVVYAFGDTIAAFYDGLYEAVMGPG
ncbi:MAG: Flp family type IVb pilin [Alphaproteobacteria bacterium]|nr:MAG: Flp family type IVb pilin [Alphaproteobacteria bacterium]